MKGCSHRCSNPLRQNLSNLYLYLCRGGTNPPKPVGDVFRESTPCTSPVFLPTPPNRSQMRNPAPNRSARGSLARWSDGADDRVGGRSVRAIPVRGGRRGVWTRSRTQGGVQQAQQHRRQQGSRQRQHQHQQQRTQLTDRIGWPVYPVARSPGRPSSPWPVPPFLS